VNRASALAELLLAKGYKAHGIVRRIAIEDPEHRLWRIKHLLDEIELHPASLESYPSIFRVLASVRPGEVYHLPAPASCSARPASARRTSKLLSTRARLTAFRSWPGSN
jgi:GDP-D-mannose dehydratase